MSNNILSFKDYSYKKLHKKLSNSTIYIARFNNGNCMPCEHCASMLARFRIKKIKYTDIIMVDDKQVKVLVELRLKSG